MDKERWKGWLISFFMETLGGFFGGGVVGQFCGQCRISTDRIFGHRADF